MIKRKPLLLPVLITILLMSGCTESDYKVAKREEIKTITVHHDDKLISKGTYYTIETDDKIHTIKYMDFIQNDRDEDTLYKLQNEGYFTKYYVATLSEDTLNEVIEEHKDKTGKTLKTKEGTVYEYIEGLNKK